MKIVNCCNGIMSSKKSKKRIPTKILKQNIYELPIGRYVFEADFYNYINQIKSYKDLDIYFGIQCLDCVNKTNIFEIVNSQPNYCRIIFNEKNHLSGTKKDGGDLTTFGDYIVKIIDQNGIHINLTNISENAFLSVLSKVETPCMYETDFLPDILGNTPLKPYQEKALIETGGLVVVNLDSAKFMLSKIADNVIKFGRKYGFDNIALSGSSFCFNSNANRFINILNMTGCNKFDLEKIAYRNAEKFFNIF